MNVLDHPWWFFVVMLVCLLLVEEAGFRLGAASPSNKDEEKHKQIQETRNEIAVLLSLLLGFTLSMALTRFDERRQLAVDDANAIGTTYLRAQMLNEPIRSQSMKLLGEYVTARLRWVDVRSSRSGAQEAVQESKRLQDELWQLSVGVAQQTPTPIVSIYVQTLNNMIDLHEKRLVAFENRVPRGLWLMLVLIGVFTCLSVGFSQRRRVFFSMIVTPLTIAIVMGLIADIDSPESGFVRVSQGSMHRVQLDLKAPSRPDSASGSAAH